MATGRTVSHRFDRVYMDGLDISAYAQGAGAIALGPLSWEFPEVMLNALSDAAQGALPGQPRVSPGTLNGIFDNTATGLHVLASPAGTKRLISLARGIRAAPVSGDPCFTCYAVQKNYMATENGGAAFATLDFGPTDVTTHLLFNKPWGDLLHPFSTETAVNTAVGFDRTLAGAATAFGGWFWYHASTSNGTCTIKAQDAATNVDGSFSDISLLTSGVINPSSVPLFGIVGTLAGATIRQFLRWQIVLGTATTVTFSSGIIRVIGLGQ